MSTKYLVHVTKSYLLSSIPSTKPRLKISMNKQKERKENVLCQGERPFSELCSFSTATS